MLKVIGGMMRDMKKFGNIVSLLVVIVTLLTVTNVHAQSSNGLSISPRKDYTIQPGKSVTDTLFIQNLSLNQELQVGIRLIDFSAADESGTPALQLDKNAPLTPWSLRPFAKVQNTVRIAAGKSVYVPITITIPATQGAGSYYSAVEYTAQNPQTKQKVNISASTASLLFATVPGEATEKLVLKQFGAYSSPADARRGPGSFKSFFLGDAPKEFAYRLQNSGNVAEKPSGSLLVKNIFGRTVKEVDDANPKKQLVLIGQTRRIQVCIKSSILTSKDSSGQQSQQAVCDDPGLLPGRYTAQIALFYGVNGNASQELTATTSFWYFPWWSLIIFGILVALLIGLVWLIRRAFGNRYTKYRR
jgi:hypothetical protein